MRLRISVQRHALPPTNILWTVPDGQSPQAYIIARLLEDVNRIIPLEAECWGLEDYVVEVGGFECLHFSPVSQVLKDEDQVSIRCLITADVRARTLSGRLQISEGGQHLVDGIPFGRPYLREPNRPPIRIPPLKRRRLVEDVSVEEEDQEILGLLTEHGHVSSSEQGSDAVMGDESDQEHERPRQPKSGRKAVRFQEPPEEEASDSEDDEDFDPDSDMESSSVSSSSVSTSDGSSSESSDDDSDEGPEEIIGNGKRKATTAGVEGSSSDSNSTSSDSDSDSNSSSSESEVAAKPSTQKTAQSNAGKKATRARNARRKDSKLLKKILQPLGIASPEATLAEARDFRGKPEHVRHQLIENAKVMIGYPGTDRPKKKKQKSANQALHITNQAPHIFYNQGDAGVEQPTGLEAAENISTPQEDTTKDLPSEPKAAPQNERQQLEARRAALLAQLDSGGVDITPQKPTNGIPRSNVISTPAAPTPETPPPSLKRPRLDIGAAGRMIKAGIPLQKKRKVVAQPESTPYAPSEPTDPDAWKTKINYSAYECWYEEFDELSAPPFPFKQHWDKESCDAMKLKYTAKKNKQKNKAKKSTEEDDFSASKDVVMLDYGDGGPVEKKPKERDVDDIIQYQLQKDVDTETPTDPNNPSTRAKAPVPPVPEDPSFYPPLTTDMLKVGVVVLFKHFTMDSGAPEISPPKTAVVECVEDGEMLGLRMKEEDIGSMEKDDDGYVWLVKGELLEAKLLQDLEVEKREVPEAKPSEDMEVEVAAT
ncbi:hypothetical protein BCR34DRAFT_599334 [Clohesyomyces aquaticus]|uniref:DUF7357 domain-containing protein n=1 Tax=Clohesyomyces aquaticus TaxID=1231657 RepID=A0A1Y1ZV73_9PLEO|nr:hypothetical protein BCR34DRAFT_599334 [Clohesyomyces aquaticus]